MNVPHRATPRTVRWPEPRCPACCDGGGSASWSCSRAWTGTAESAPSHRTQPGPQEATARTTRPGETRRNRRRACRCRRGGTLQPRRAKSRGHWRRPETEPRRTLSPADCGFSAATFQAAAVGRRRRRLIFLFTFTPTPLLCLLPFVTSDFLSLSLFPFYFLHLSPMIRAWFLLDEKPTSLNPFTTYWHKSLHFPQFNGLYIEWIPLLLFTPDMANLLVTAAIVNNNIYSKRLG